MAGAKASPAGLRSGVGKADLEGSELSGWEKGDGVKKHQGRHDLMRWGDSQKYQKLPRQKRGCGGGTKVGRVEKKRTR